MYLKIELLFKDIGIGEGQIKPSKMRDKLGLECFFVCSKSEGIPDHGFTRVLRGNLHRCLERTAHRLRSSVSFISI
jgi:hypothetical protein